jgi:pimeloyl-ACP methyl ester carboxylesterase
MLDDITLYWLTNTGTSGARLYWEHNTNPIAVAVAIPTALTGFPGEISQVPKRWAERAYHTLIYDHRVDQGGHCAAWEEPHLFAEEIRAALRSLRSSWPAALMRDSM